MAAVSTGRAVPGPGVLQNAAPRDIHPHSHSSWCWLGPRRKFLFGGKFPFLNGGGESTRSCARM